MEILIDGTNVKDEKDFHSLISSALSFSSYYGRNLDALFDVLSTDVERPITLIWKNSEVSKINMGDDFERVVNVLRRVERQDADWKLDEKFKLQLN